MSLYGIKDSANVTLFEPKTGKPVLYADYCNQTSLNMSADAVYAMKKTAKAISWDTNREGTLTMEMQVFDLKWIALLFGQSVQAGALDWAKREVVKLGSGRTLTVAEGIKEGSATVYKLNKDGITLGDEIQAFSFTDGERVITLDASVTAAEGDEFSIFYLTEKGAGVGRSFTVESDKFPKGYRAIFDTMIRDTDQEDHFVQFEFYNLKPKSSLDLTLSAEDVCTLSIEWDVLVDNRNRFFTFNYLDETDADASGEPLDGYAYYDSLVTQIYSIINAADYAGTDTASKENVISALDTIAETVVDTNGDRFTKPGTDAEITALATAISNLTTKLALVNEDA